MSTYSDNQTGHFFVAAGPNDVRVTKPVDHKFRVKVTNGSNVNTSDLLDDRLILKSGVKAVSPVYYRKWEVAPMENPTKATTYSLYFYLENLLGFGLADRWDIVASYTTKDNDSNSDAATETVTEIMTAIKKDLIEKIGAVGAKHADGPIANDFIVTMDGNKIVVKENPASKTYQFESELDIRTNDHPYVYDLTLSTYDGNAIWGSNDKVIYATPTSEVRIKAGTIVMDMEHFFSRNRADLYDLTPNFGLSIINKLYANADKNYSIVNIHYAFSDGQGFSYRSEKDLNIAVEEASAGATTNGAAVLAELINPSTAVNVGYINDAASYAAYSDMLTTDYADKKKAGDSPEVYKWAGDGWLVLEFPAGSYSDVHPVYTDAAGNTYTGADATEAASWYTGKTYAIYSTTDGDDWTGDAPCSTASDPFDINKVTVTLS